MVESKEMLLVLDFGGCVIYGRNDVWRIIVCK